MPSKPGRPPKNRLDRGKILRATIALLQQGENSLSMRALAAKLKVDPMALYYYFPDRNAILRAALEQVYAGLADAPAPRANWQLTALEYLLAYHSIALKNFGLTQFLLSHGDLDIPAIATFNTNLLQILGAAGFDANRTELMRDLLIDYLHGYLAAEIHFSHQEKRKRSGQVRKTLSWVLDSLR